jgi:Domain of unknown function (DUF4476)
MTVKIKIIFLVLVFLNQSVHFLAQNNLRLLSANGEPIKVSINNKVFNQIAQAEILIENILQDTITIKFEFENKQNLSTSIFLLNKGLKDKHKEHYYFVSQKKGELILEFKSISEIIDLPRHIVPLKPSVDSSKYKNIIDHLCEIKNEKAEFFNNLPAQSTCKNPMPDVYLQHLNLLMKKATKADQKLYLGEEICKNNCLSITQLKNIIGHLEVEFDKLIVAKLGFFNLVDTSHKFNILKEFKFEASIKDMKDFLMNSKSYQSRYSVNCSVVTDDSFVNTFIQKLVDAGNDSYRLDLLKKNYYNYCFSVKQISRILETFFHDRERFQACKLVYFKCSEKDNFIVLTESFSYPQFISQLKEFINSQNK